MPKVSGLPIMQRELGRLVGLSQKSISNLLSGKRHPSRPTSVKLAYALGVDWKEILTATPDELKRIIKEAHEQGRIAAIPWKEAKGRPRK